MVSSWRLIPHCEFHSEISVCDIDQIDRIRSLSSSSHATLGGTRRRKHQPRLINWPLLPMSIDYHISSFRLCIFGATKGNALGKHMTWTAADRPIPYSGRYGLCLFDSLSTLTFYLVMYLIVSVFSETEEQS